MKRLMWAALLRVRRDRTDLRTAASRRPLPKPVELVLEDQFERKTDLADLRGNVVILVYGDRKGTDACRTLGEQLHVCWHPTAKGQPPAKAQAAPVVPLDGLKPGQVSPNVIVVPVACCGKVPAAVRAVDPHADREGLAGRGRVARLRGHDEGDVRPDRGRDERGGLRRRPAAADEAQRHRSTSRRWTSS